MPYNSIYTKFWKVQQICREKISHCSLGQEIRIVEDVGNVAVMGMSLS